MRLAIPDGLTKQPRKTYGHTPSRVTRAHPPRLAIPDDHNDQERKNAWPPLGEGLASKVARSDARPRPTGTLPRVSCASNGTERLARFFPPPAAAAASCARTCGERSRSGKRLTPQLAANQEV